MRTTCKETGTQILNLHEIRSGMHAMMTNADNRATRTAVIVNGLIGIIDAA